MIKSRITRWVGHAALIGDRIIVRKSDRKDYVENPRIGEDM
jgi:hypothetical protein